MYALPLASNTNNKKKNAYRVGAYAPFTVPTPTLHLWVQYFLNYGLSKNYSHILQEPQSGLRYEH